MALAHTRFSRGELNVDDARALQLVTAEPDRLFRATLATNDVKFSEADPRITVESMESLRESPQL
jgi:hypothetical protein